MIDIHCHILPDIDDGPRYVNTSIDMARLAVRDGIKTIIATPHTDGIRVNRDIVKNSVAQLNAVLRDEGIKLEILVGYEIPSDLVYSLAECHTLANSKYILLEFPHTHLPADAIEIIQNTIQKGLTPIVAHPERNPEIMAKPELLIELIDIGALAQLTATSVIGELGPDVQKCSHYLLLKDKVHFIATDSHSPVFRKPALKKTRKIVSKLIGRKKTDIIFLHNTQKILQQGKLSET